MKQIAVVSLIEEYERRKHIDSLFKEFELDFDYLDAINKQQVANALEKYNLTINTDRMSLGEVACYLSHYSLWQQMIDNDLPYLIVFEDDIYFAKNAKTLLNDLSWLPDNFDLIKLETMYDRVMVKPESVLRSSYELLRLKTQHLGTAGYIISHSGAKNMIKLVKQTGIHCPVDHLMFDKFIESNSHIIYQTSPALCIQDKIFNTVDFKFGSMIEEDRAPKASAKPKLSASQKINREYKRLIRQSKLLDKYRNSVLSAKGYKNKTIDFQQ